MKNISVNYETYKSLSDRYDNSFKQIKDIMDNINIIHNRMSVNLFLMPLASAIDNRDFAEKAHTDILIDNVNLIILEEKLYNLKDMYKFSLN